MALPSSGAISLSAVNTELGLSATATISMNDAAVRTLFGVGSGAINMGNGYGKANAFSFTISANQTNANLRTLAVNAGWNQSTKVIATINSGVVVSSSSTGTPGLTVNGSFPGGVELINNGYIIGMGGAGGAGATFYYNANGGAGGGGGNALTASVAVSITNNGTIGGGGGGGGGNSNFLGPQYDSYGQIQSQYGAAYGGSGGGGGRTGSTNSSGGTGGTSQYSSAAASGTAGTFSAPGTRGGQWGAAGTGGTNYTPRNAGNAGGGGAAGSAVSGNANITWVATGTRLGAIA